MPKVEQIGLNKYKYQCTCGATIIYETDEKPKRVIKCFECLKKEDERRGKKDENKS